MNKIIVPILIVLLIIAIGFGAYSFQKGAKAGKLLQTKITALEAENGALQQKVNKGLVYAKMLDLLYEPVRKQMGLATRYGLTDANWVSEFSRVTESTGDSALESYFQGILKGDADAQTATVRFMEHAISKITDSLK